jgi:glycosyltransferase involved in cell wall biosynthesis
MAKALAPDLLHFACSRSHKLGGLACLGLPMAKVVTRRMDYPLRPNPWKRWLYRSAVDGVVCVSAAVRREVLGLGLPPARARLVHDGVESRRFEGLAFSAARAPARARLQLDPGALIGVTPASLHRRKGQDVLLQALALLAQRLPGQCIQWVFAGEGPSLESLQSLAATLPPSVEALFPGRVQPVEDLLAAADLFCLPSRREGLGVALLEAMAAGLPVVASHVGGMVEAFEDPACGRHVPPEDPEALAEAIASLARETQAARSMGRRAAERCRELFDLERMCRDTEAFYLELLEGGPKQQNNGEGS